MRDRLPLVAGSAAVAALGAWALASSPFLGGIAQRRFVPWVGDAGPFWILVALLLALLMAAAAMPRRSPAPLLAGAVGVALLAGFEHSHLDWLLALARKPTTTGLVPAPWILLPALAVLAAALAVAQWALWARAEQRYLAKGAAPEEAAHARTMARGSALAVGGTMGLSLGVGAVFWLWAGGGPLPPASHVGAAAYPLAALAVLGLLLARAMRAPQ